MAELDSNIKELKSNKSAGSDNVLNEFIVHAPFSIRLLILTIFNNILTLEYFPECWALGGIVPIHKSGDKNIANNYRGISLICIIAKIYNRLILNRIRSVIDIKLRINQNGFRPKRTTVGQIHYSEKVSKKYRF